jgi:F-type H+-transporting ATPase subunit epsilon
MSHQFQFELVSPEKLLVSKPVVMVTIPGGEGDYGVLIGHAPLITMVRPGVIDIYEQDENILSERIFVAGGFAETTTDRCTVLAEIVIPISELNRAAIDDEMTNLAEIAETVKTDLDRVYFEKQQTIIRAKLQAMA